MRQPEQFREGVLERTDPEKLPANWAQDFSGWWMRGWGGRKEGEETWDNNEAEMGDGRKRSG